MLFISKLFAVMPDNTPVVLYSATLIQGDDGQFHGGHNLMESTTWGEYKKRLPGGLRIPHGVFSQKEPLNILTMSINAEVTITSHKGESKAIQLVLSLPQISIEKQYKMTELYLEIKRLDKELEVRTMEVESLGRVLSELQRKLDHSKTN